MSWITQSHTSNPQISRKRPYMYGPEQLAASLARVREHAERNGRDPSEIRGAIHCWDGVDEDRVALACQAIDTVSDTYRQDFANPAYGPHIASAPGSRSTGTPEPANSSSAHSARATGATRSSHCSHQRYCPDFSLPDRKILHNVVTDHPYRYSAECNHSGRYKLPRTSRGKYDDHRHPPHSSDK